MDRIAAVLGGEAGDDGADQDGEEGAAFDQRIAGRQFFARQMIGQDAVFDRAEQRRDGAEQEYRDKQQDERMKGEARNGKPGDDDLAELQPLRHHGFVVAVGKLAAEPRE